jgi:hemerythrin-like domain-containing protein
MNYSGQTARMLHDDHVAALRILERLGGMLSGGQAMADVGDTVVARLLSDLDGALESELRPHFAFEEDQLFKRLSDNGYGAMADHLTEEHEVILPLAAGILALARAARATGFTAESWGKFTRQGNEFIDRLTSHIHKEDMALLPLIDDLLDKESDDTLALLYAQSR